jgi:hypothetical protein
MQSDPQKDTTHPLWYASAALFYFTAMVCTNMALRWINYPTQVIAKSAKPIPTMVKIQIIFLTVFQIQKIIIFSDSRRFHRKKELSHPKVRFRLSHRGRSDFVHLQGGQSET